MGSSPPAFLFDKPAKRRPLGQDFAKDLALNATRADPVLHYELTEVRDTIKREVASVKKRKIELQDELVLTKQLLKNIEKNRLKILKDYLTAGKDSQAENLSIRRKLAIQTIKEKLDQQASTMNQKELAATDLLQGVRRQEKLLSQCKELMD